MKNGSIFFSIRQFTTGEIESNKNQDDVNRTPAAYEIQTNLLIVIRQLSTGELQLPLSENITNRPPATDDIYTSLDSFLKTGFTHHCEILTKVKSIEERLFYIERCTTEFWSVETLRYHLKSKLFSKLGKLPNNFQTTISDKDLQRKALMSFKDEYLLDYINIESPDDEPDERVVESEIVNNIRKFIMSLGKDFSFVGNQHRIMVDEKEYFIDLLFFNRQLQCLVAFDLKQQNRWAWQHTKRRQNYLPNTKMCCLMWNG